MARSAKVFSFRPPQDLDLTAHLNHNIDLMNQKGSISSAFGIIVTLVIAAGVGGYIYVQSQQGQCFSDALCDPNSYGNKQPPPPTPLKTSPPQGIACTQEAKQCPDRSYVGRTGPKCEFAACPGEKPVSQSVIPADWKTYRNEKYGFEMKYPADWNFEIIDSYNSDGTVLTPENKFYFTDGALHRIIILPLGPGEGGLFGGPPGPVEIKNITLSGMNVWWRKYADSKGVYGIMIDHFPNTRYPAFSMLFIPINAREYIDPSKLTLFDQIASTFKFTK